MAGFNRRFAPKVKEMAELVDKRRILVEKNEVNQPADLQFKLFDLFIHPLDTALYLAAGQLTVGHFQYHLIEDGLLSQVSVQLQTEKESILVSMNLQSGSRREVMEVQTPYETVHLENLDDLTRFTGNTAKKESFGSWDTTLYKRGFESIVDEFLETIEIGGNPVSPETSLLSRYICHQINQSASSTDELQVELPV